MTNEAPTTRCPKCGYQRRPEDQAPAWQCPSCQVAYAKVARLAGPAPTATTATTAATATAQEGDAEALADQLATETAVLAECCAQGQRAVILGILLGFVLRAIDNTHALPALPIIVLYAGLALYMLHGITRLGSGLQLDQGRKLLCLVLAFVPLANLVMLVYLNARAVKLLRSAGWRVGLLGGRP